MRGRDDTVRIFLSADLITKRCSVDVLSRALQTRTCWDGIVLSQAFPTKAMYSHGDAAASIHVPPASYEWHASWCVTPYPHHHARTDRCGDKLRTSHEAKKLIERRLYDINVITCRCQRYGCHGTTCDYTILQHGSPIGSHTSNHRIGLSEWYIHARRSKASVVRGRRTYSNVVDA